MPIVRVFFLQSGLPSLDWKCKWWTNNSKPVNWRLIYSRRKRFLSLHSSLQRNCCKMHESLPVTCAIGVKRRVRLSNANVSRIFNKNNLRDRTDLSSVRHSLTRWFMRVANYRVGAWVDFLANSWCVRRPSVHTRRTNAISHKLAKLFTSVYGEAANSNALAVHRRAVWSFPQFKDQIWFIGCGSCKASLSIKCQWLLCHF